MTLKEKIIQELEQSPDTLLEEFLNFILFVKQRRQSEDRDLPIWQVAANLTQDIPAEVLEQLPTDGAAEHDHYLYGTPKRV
ncbi:hypothetical protein [[Limnothrix rosea] IAM M-220]|uniref:hypothetical protein n=1 Tax=[Limnothrix rosea] IAM M-220 TaxID=454133 RepID=UPI00095A44D3|nr:hypothetical protein [[Limnothrix rosea] IAM M-220]OKH17858.1 hypothetical protein NIES208_07600 [[Limnothrix rosea] IAM M-220]